MALFEYGARFFIVKFCTESENESSSPFYLFVIYAFSSFLHFRHFYTSAGQTCIAVVSKSKIDEEKLSSGTNDDYPDLSNHARIGTLRYCHHHKPLLYSKNFAKLFSTQCHANSCGDVLGLCAPLSLSQCCKSPGNPGRTRLVSYNIGTHALEAPLAEFEFPAKQDFIISQKSG